MKWPGRRSETLFAPFDGYFEQCVCVRVSIDLNCGIVPPSFIFLISTSKFEDTRKIIFFFFVDLLTININKTHTHTERYVNREHKRRTLNENIDELGIRNDLIRFSRFNFFLLDESNQTFWTDVDGYSRRRSSRARLSLYDIHARTDQLPTPEAHIGTLSLTNVITGLYFE